MTDTNEIERLILQLLRQRGRLTLGFIVAEIRVRMRGITGIGAPTASEVEGAMTDLVYADRIEKCGHTGVWDYLETKYYRLTDAEIKRAFDTLIK